MGKQSSKILRTKAKELQALYPDKFTTDFDKNKEALNELEIFPSKISRNIVAGMLTSLSQEVKL